MKRHNIFSRGLLKSNFRKFHPTPINCSNSSVAGESREESMLDLAPSWSRYGAWGSGTKTTLICKVGDPNTLHSAEQLQSSSQQSSRAKTERGRQVRFLQAYLSKGMRS